MLRTSRLKCQPKAGQQSKFDILTCPCHAAHIAPQGWRSSQSWPSSAAPVPQPPRTLQTQCRLSCPDRSEPRWWSHAQTAAPGLDPAGGCGIAGRRQGRTPCGWCLLDGSEGPAAACWGHSVCWHDCTASKIRHQIFKFCKIKQGC